MSKMKIDIRRPQYLTPKEKEPVAEPRKKETVEAEEAPFIFRFLLTATYILSAVAIWFIYQKYSAHS